MAQRATKRGNRVHRISHLHHYVVRSEDGTPVGGRLTGPSPAGCCRERASDTRIDSWIVTSDKDTDTKPGRGWERRPGAVVWFGSNDPAAIRRVEDRRREILAGRCGCPSVNEGALISWQRMAIVPRIYRALEPGSGFWARYVTDCEADPELREEAAKASLVALADAVGEGAIREAFTCEPWDDLIPRQLERRRLRLHHVVPPRVFHRDPIATRRGTTDPWRPPYSSSNRHSARRHRLPNSCLACRSPVRRKGRRTRGAGPGSCTAYTGRCRASVSP